MTGETHQIPPSNGGDAIDVLPQKKVKKLKHISRLIRGPLKSCFHPHATHEEEMKDKEARGEPLSILDRLAVFMQSHPVQVFFLLLLVVDVCLVITELIISSRLEPVFDVLKETEGCESAALLYNSTLNTYTMAPGQCSFKLKLELPKHLEDAERGLQITGFVILYCFAAELLLLMISMPRHFFTEPLYLLDVAIIITSLVLEHLENRDSSGEATHLVIIARLWRFARIMHGVGMTTHEYEEMVEVHSPHSPSLRQHAKFEPTGVDDAHAPPHHVSSSSDTTKNGEPFGAAEATAGESVAPRHSSDNRDAR